MESLALHESAFEPFAISLQFLKDRYHFLPEENEVVRVSSVSGLILAGLRFVTGEKKTLSTGDSLTIRDGRLPQH